MENTEFRQKYPYDLGKTIECFLGIIMIIPALYILLGGMEGYGLFYDNDEQIEGIFWGLLSIGGSILIKNNVKDFINFIKYKYAKFKIWKQQRKLRK